MHFNLLTMLLFTELFWCLTFSGQVLSYRNQSIDLFWKSMDCDNSLHHEKVKERMASLFTKYLYKCSIYAFASNLIILTFLKVMYQHLGGGGVWNELQWGLAQVVDKAQRWGGGVKSVRTPWPL